MSRADICDRRTGRKRYRELDMAVIASRDLGFTGSENYIDYTGSREIVSLLLQFDGGASAILARDYLDGRLVKERALPRPTAGGDDKREDNDGENPANTAPSASPSSESQARNVVGHAMMYRIRMRPSEGRTELRPSECKKPTALVRDRECTCG